jgi:hypothetical protein
MPSRRRPPSLNPEAQRARMRFATVLRRRVEEDLGVPPAHSVKWVADRVGVNWQTAQFWMEGTSIPRGENLTRLVEVVGLDPWELVGGPSGPPSDQHRDPASWGAFLETPEGASMTDAERAVMARHPWLQAPTVSDWRSLLALIRANAER